MTVDHHTVSKIAIITGGSRGIGRDTVIRLAQNGVRSIFTYNSNLIEAENVVSLAAEAGSAAIALQLNVGETVGFVEAVRGALGSLGAERFDYLVNNAGNSSNANLETLSETEMDLLFAIHFKGPLFLTQALLPLINDGGRIINLSSGLARFTAPGRIGYGSIKAAVETLTRYMAMDLSSRRISVNVVAPGPVATDFSGGVVRDNADINKYLAGQTALGRVAGPEDIGPVIAALLSEEMGWINAQRIEVAGGIHI